MKSEIYLSAKITDDDLVKVDINGPVSEVLELLEDEAVSIFKALKNGGDPDTLEVMRTFFKNVAEGVFGDDL